MATVLVTGWLPGFQTVSAIQLLAHTGQLGLREAQRMIELLLSGEPIQLEVQTDRDASTLASRLVGLGAIVSPPAN